MAGEDGRSPDVAAAGAFPARVRVGAPVAAWREVIGFWIRQDVRHHLILAGQDAAGRQERKRVAHATP